MGPFCQVQSLAMAAARPLVSVYKADNQSEVVASVGLPAVLTAPIRMDVVQQAHTGMAKNHRQAYSVNVLAGKQTAAESWGTGRAVSRIPRVPGGGTHRAGQGAFGNMCRGGRMFCPTKTYRKWHQKVNINQRRFAVSSALAASAVPALVMARGHRIDEISEVPLVIDDTIQMIQKTANAMSVLKRFNLLDDVDKVKDSKKIRRGKGKMRNRRYTARRGPLIIYKEDNGLVKAFRNIPGVELCCVDRLNLLQLAPGGHLGRLCLWTQGAFKSLDSLFGGNGKKSSKKGFTLPRPSMTNADLARIINSDEVQSKVKPASATSTVSVLKANPLKNKGRMDALNPAAADARKRATKATEDGKKAKAALVESKRKGTYKPDAKAKKAAIANKKIGKEFYKTASARGV